MLVADAAVAADGELPCRFANIGDLFTTGTFTVTLPAGYTWAASGAITTTETGLAFVVGNGTMAGGASVTFAVTAVPDFLFGFPATLAFSGGVVTAASGAAAGNIVLTYSGNWSGGSLTVATISIPDIALLPRFTKSYCGTTSKAMVVRDCCE